MSDNINQYLLGETLIYTASLSPHLQGVNLTNIGQLQANLTFKIHGNEDFLFALDGVPQTQRFFNDTLSFENLGRDPDTGKSQVSLDTPGKITTIFDHRVSQRELGQTDSYNDGNPFEEADSLAASHLIEINPLILTVPLNIVQQTPIDKTEDGIIEVFTIRGAVDFSSIELPFLMRTVRADNSNDDARRQSILISDTSRYSAGTTIPFLDSIETFGAGEPIGGIDLPGAFSDGENSITPFVESSDDEILYGDNSTLDAEIRFMFLNKTGSYPNTIRSDEVVARHGFIFSQNENYKYDSIAFAGLKN